MGSELNKACRVKKRSIARRECEARELNNEMRRSLGVINEMNKGIRIETNKYKKWWSKEVKKLETKKRRLEGELKQLNKEMSNLHKAWMKD